ncbi:hypothetical protein IMZ11_26805 [Microtetraspora sp. AC03309]|uniref:hypothetical protein n=1 Tax=Microtetraspora sp. AC03309 TaxID=2779376 RepID=UPI001E5FBA79|nr:hypothetical protein [Microtetraspora sp. AC03309]MCC5579243.1 hypothetical protein [Microtetraspora sp. AC03309]
MTESLTCHFDRYAAERRDDAGEAWAKAAARVTGRIDEGEYLTASDLAEIALHQHLHGWWRWATALIENEGVNGANAILQVRQQAEHHLIDMPPVRHGGLFEQAMAEARREAAQRFLKTTEKLAAAAEARA